jgi:hypothetical protein
MNEEQQQMRKNPDFVFVLQVPVNVPTEEEVAIISPHLETYIKELVSMNHLSREEAVAYVKFSSELGSFTPFMMDAFLQSYRKNTAEQENSTIRELRENAKLVQKGSRIIT